ncbi:MAG: ATP-binding cassette domain-containing protein [Pirellulaceae bacterium]|nr:ATP-binding cassette domain-containing protein [Pirellulaceae bacterium]
MNDSPTQPGLTARGPAEPLEGEWDQHRQLADFDEILRRLRQWVDAAPRWPAFARSAALLERVEPQLKQVRLRLDSVLVVGFVGGTGTGKSTLINALAGEQVCQAGKVQRPTTLRPEVLCNETVDLSVLGLGDFPVEVHRRKLALLENMILVDCPDPDTQPTAGEATANRNRDVLRAVLPHCDVIVVVGSQQKYKTEAVISELLRHAPGRKLVFVQSQATRDEDIRSDWSSFLAARGFQVREIYLLDAQEALEARLNGRPVEPAFAGLAHLLQVQLANRARHRIKRSNAFHLCQWTFGQLHALLDEAQQPLGRLEREVSSQQDQLREKIRRGLHDTLQSNRYTWRTKLLEQLLQKWSGGPFAGFLRLVNALGSWTRWALVARSRSATELAVTSSLAALSAVRDKWNEARAARVLSNSQHLGITVADVAQARSVLLAYAEDAGLDELVDIRSGSGRERFCEQTLADLAGQVQLRVDDALDVAARQRVAWRAGPACHWLFELLFLVVPVGVIVKLGMNFFYENLVQAKPLLGTDYLVHSLIWILVAAFLLRGALLWWLAAGLRGKVMQVADEVVRGGILEPLADDVTQAATRVHGHCDALWRVERDFQRLADELRQVEELQVSELEPGWK